jgi:hypothetical protein
MPIEERDAFDIDDDRPWPSPHDDHRFTDDCDACNVTRFILGVESDLRHACRDLWFAGWAPMDLIDQVRRATRRTDAADLVAQALIVDDSHRSDQARSPEWGRAIDSLRSMTGIDDVSTGWIARWIASRRDPETASVCLAAVLDALLDLLRPVANVG